mgnify:CR=1 FL=1
MKSLNRRVDPKEGITLSGYYAIRERSAGNMIRKIG